MTRVGWIVLNTVLLLALAEGAARIAEWLHPPAEELSFDYAPYRMLKMSRAPWPLNRQGFRARELETYRDTFLIEFLGGSVCLGVGTNPGRTLPERLEDTLHRAGLVRATVLNLCQGGAASAQELAIFLEYGLPLAPQVVLSFDGANDLMHPRPIGEDDAANLPYRDREMRALFQGHHTFVAHLALARVAARIAADRAAAPAGPPVSADSILNSYLYATEVTHTLTRAQGGWYAVLFQPTLHYRKPWSVEERAMWRERRPRQDAEAVSKRAAGLYRQARIALTDWSKETGAAVFDLSGVFAETSDTVYSDGVHFTGETGYARLSAELERQGWIERITEQYREWEAGGRVESAGGRRWAP
jgi:hypothetical protein